MNLQPFWDYLYKKKSHLSSSCLNWPHFIRNSLHSDWLQPQQTVSCITKRLFTIGFAVCTVTKCFCSPQNLAYLLTYLQWHSAQFRWSDVSWDGIKMNWSGITDVNIPFVSSFLALSLFPTLSYRKAALRNPVTWRELYALPVGSVVKLNE